MSPGFPALIVGLFVATYWTRVVHMAIRARRKTGRGANFVPAEKTGRWLRFIWVPVVTLWVVVPFATFFDRTPNALLRVLYTHPAIAWAGAAVAAVALFATFVCWRRMGKAWRMGIDPNEKNPLIITGPWGYVRHPIYALSSLLMLATVIVLPSPAMIVVGLLHLLLLQWEARREERHLISVHGEAYRRYCAGVGRFVPVSLTPYARRASTT